MFANLKYGVNCCRASTILFKYNISKLGVVEVLVYADSADAGGWVGGSKIMENKLT